MQTEETYPTPEELRESAERNILEFLDGITGRIEAGGDSFPVANPLTSLLALEDPSKLQGFSDDYIRRIQELYRLNPKLWVFAQQGLRGVEKDSDWIKEFERDYEYPSATIQLIELTREALVDGRPQEVLESLIPLVAACESSGIIGPEDGEEILDWAFALEVTSVESLYRLTHADIVIPEVIIPVNDELLHRMGKYPEEIFRISPRQFEELIAEVFSRYGYETYLTTRTRDGGRDIIAFTNNADILVKIIIECKRYARTRRVGLGVVQRLLGVKVADNASKAVLVTTSSFTKPAVEFASKHFWDLELKDYQSIAK